MYILTYLNQLDDKDYLDSITIKRLVDNIRAMHSLADGWYFNPTGEHAETIIREIRDWEIDEMEEL